MPSSPVSVESLRLSSAQLQLNLGSDFDGPVYRRDQDHQRLTGQILRVFTLMSDGKWRTLQEIALITQDPQPSVSAQLRHLRKPKFGAFIVERRARGERQRGLFEYRLLPPEQEASAP